MLSNSFFKQYTIKEEFQFSKYALDFVVVELKIDIEIDGQPHYRSGGRSEGIEHDKKRDSFLREHGWHIFRINADKLINETAIEIEKLIAFISEKHATTDMRYGLSDIEWGKYINKYKNREEYFKESKVKRIESNKPKIDLIMNSGIDFFKFGWVKKVALLIGIKEQKVNGWMKLYMLDFYNEHCFKRQSANK